MRPVSLPVAILLAVSGTPVLPAPAQSQPPTPPEETAGTLALHDPAAVAAASLAEAQRLRAALPAGAAAMIDTAVRSNDPDRVRAVVDVAKETWPEAADAIVSYEKLARREDKEIRYSRIETGSFFDYWSGNLSVGGSSATGNSSSNNYVVSASILKDGPRWRHAAEFDLAYSLSSNDDPTKRASGFWQSNRKIDEKRFVYARFGYLKNFSAGIRNRFVESVGVGSRFLNTEKLSWVLEAGPAARQTEYYDGSSRDGFALRLSNRGNWQFSRYLALSNSNSVYLAGDATVDNTTKLTSSLTDQLTVSISFNFQWEENPAPTYAQTSTLTAITIGYDF